MKMQQIFSRDREHVRLEMNDCKPVVTDGHGLK